MSLGDARAVPGRTRIAFPGWVGDLGHLRELIRVVQLIATDALERATAEMAASEPERRASWDAELPGIERASRTQEWEALERRRREELKEHYAVTMQAREGPLGNAWRGDALETLDRTDPSRLQFVHIWAGEAEGPYPWHRQIEVALSSACGSVLVLVGPAAWMAQAQAAVAPLLRQRAPWYKVLRAPATAAVICLGSGVAAWLLFNLRLQSSESLLLAWTVLVVIAVGYQRVLNWAAPQFELIPVGGRPRSLFRLPLVAASPFLAFALVAALARAL